MRAAGTFMGRTRMGEAWIATHKPPKNAKECRRVDRCQTDKRRVAEEC